MPINKLTTQHSNKCKQNASRLAAGTSLKLGSSINYDLPRVCSEWTSPRIPDARAVRIPLTHFPACCSLASPRAEIAVFASAAVRLVNSRASLLLILVLGRLHLVHIIQASVTKASPAPKSPRHPTPLIPSRSSGRPHTASPTARRPLQTCQTPRLC